MRQIAALTITFTLLHALALGDCKTATRAWDNTGTIFIVEILMEGQGVAKSVERSVKVLQSRLKTIGLDGDVRHLDGNRVEVKIFGETDLARVRNFLFKTHTLEFRKVVSSPNPHPVEIFFEEGKAKAAAVSGQQVVPYTERNENKLQFLILEKDPIITGEHVRSASAVSRGGSEPDYLIEFAINDEGATKLGDWTANNINNYLAVVLDNKVESVAFIRSRISDMGEITGMFTKEQAEDIARILNSGYMPGKLKVVEERKF